MAAFHPLGQAGLPLGGSGCRQGLEGLLPATPAFPVRKVPLRFRVSVFSVLGLMKGPFLDPAQAPGPSRARHEPKQLEAVGRGPGLLPSASARSSLDSRHKRGWKQSSDSLRATCKTTCVVLLIGAGASSP